MPLFALAAFTPAPLLLAGAMFGGLWIWAAFLYMGVLTLLLDQIVPLAAGDATEGQEFPGTDALLVALAVGHLAALPTATWAVAGPSGLGAGERVLLFLAAGFWFGQVSHPAAHELIHRPARGLFRLGAAIYTTLLFGQHVSAHRLVHHRHVASGADPNTAARGKAITVSPAAPGSAAFARAGGRKPTCAAARRHPDRIPTASILRAASCRFWPDTGLPDRLAFWSGRALRHTRKARSCCPITCSITAFCAPRCPMGGKSLSAPGTAGTRRTGFPRP